MKIKLITRIERLEKQIKRTTTTPSLILICPADTGYKAILNYSDSKPKEAHIDDYSQFVFPSGFRGIIMLDLMDRSDGNLYSFNADRLRKRVHGAGKPFSLKLIGTDHKAGKPESLFEVTLYE